MEMSKKRKKQFESPVKRSQRLPYSIKERRKQIHAALNAHLESSSQVEIYDDEFHQRQLKKRKRRVLMDEIINNNSIVFNLDIYKLPYGIPDNIKSFFHWCAGADCETPIRTPVLNNTGYCSGECRFNTLKQ